MVSIFNPQSNLFSKAERYAAEKARELLPESSNCCYIGFPWRNFFAELRKTNSRSFPLLTWLHEALKKVEPIDKIVSYSDCEITSDQNKLLSNCRVTDFYTPYGPGAVFSGAKRVNYYPAPLLPEINIATCKEEQLIQLFPKQNRKATLKLLWHCVNKSIVPVVSTKKLDLPGDVRLWQMAVLEPKDGLDENSYLEFLRRQKMDTLVEEKKLALRQLAFLYGENRFISDICSLFFDNATIVPLELNLLVRQFQHLSASSPYSEIRLAFRTLVSKCLLSEEQVNATVKYHPVRDLIAKYFPLLNKEDKAEIERVFTFKNINFNLEQRGSC